MLRGSRKFLAWWSAELAGMVPRGLLRALGLLPPVLTLRCEDDRLVIAFGRGGRSESVPLDASGPAPLGDAVARALGGTRPNNAFVELVIDESRALRRTVRVPRAAEQEIAGIVSFEIERHTPYRADEVVYRWSAASGAADDGMLAVELVMVPRQIVDQLIAAASAAGLAPDAIRVAGGDGSFADLPPAAAGIAPVERGRAVPWLAAAALLLGLLAAGLPLLRQHREIARLEAEIELAKEKALAADRQGADAARLRETLRAVIAAKQAAPPATRIIDRLSAILPDGTWLHHVSVVDGEVVIEGMTDRSTRLVTLLEASPLFDAVRYNAPVTRERGGRNERFSFALKLAAKGGS